MLLSYLSYASQLPVLNCSSVSALVPARGELRSVFSCWGSRQGGEEPKRTRKDLKERTDRGCGLEGNRRWWMRSPILPSTDKYIF